MWPLRTAKGTLQNTIQNQPIVNDDCKHNQDGPSLTTYKDTEKEQNAHGHV